MPKVLIVDDSEAMLEFFMHLLTMEGYVVATAVSKKTLLNKIQNFNPDIVLLDVRLSGMDGREICREIKTGRCDKTYTRTFSFCKP